MITFISSQKNGEKSYTHIHIHTYAPQNHKKKPLHNQETDKNYSLTISVAETARNSTNFHPFLVKVLISNNNLENDLALRYMAETVRHPSISILPFSFGSIFIGYLATQFSQFFAV